MRHVRVEVVEFSQSAVHGAVASVRVRGVETLVVLDVDEDVVLLGFGEEVLVFGEELDGGFGDHDVDFALDGVEGDRVVGGVRGEDGDCVSGIEGVDCGFVGLWVAFFGAREGVEAGVEAVVWEGMLWLAPWMGRPSVVEFAHMLP